MENTPGSGECARPRGTSITSSENDAGGEFENEPGGLGATNTGSTTNLGAIEGQNHPEHTNDEAEISSRDVGYGCKASRNHRASDRVPDLQQPKSNTIPAAEDGKGILAEECKGPSTEPPVTQIWTAKVDVGRPKKPTNSGRAFGHK
jgi:hypothetical protein